MSKLLKPTRRLFLAGGAGLIAAPAIVRAGSLSLLGAGKPQAAAATTTTFNPSDKGVDISLDATNLIVTNAAGSGANANVKTIASYSTGKKYCEATPTAETAPYSHGVCIGNASASLTAGPGSPDVNSAAYYMGDNSVYVAGSSVGSIGGTYTTGDVVSMSVDFGNARIWFRVNGGNWNGSALNDPATNVGGKDISAVAGALFAMAAAAKGSVSSVATWNFGASAYSYTAPSGFGNW